MKIVFKHVVACMFVFVMLVQLYLGIVQAVDSMDSGEIVQDYGLWSMHGNVSATQFSVGDTLKVLAVSDVASCYRMRIYRNASLVLDSPGDFSGSRAEAHVTLCPPQFGVGTYGVVLDVYCFNYPILGTESSETKLAAFEVTGVETKLEAKAWFDSVFRNLNFEANLTDQYGYPVANETVEFSAKLFDRQRPTDGWYPLGQAKSDSNGKVSYGLAFQTGGCGYPLKACHRANDNFGESFCEFQAETAPNWTLVHSMAMQLEEAGSKFSIASEPLGWFRIGLNTTDPNAMLPFKFSAEYWIDQPLSGEFVGFSFYRDEVSFDGWFSLCMASYNGSCYLGNFVWSCPNVTGNHRFYVGVWHGNVNNITMARYGLGLHDCTSRDVFISLCPTNMVVQVAGATSTNYWPVLVAFSKPRLYESAPTSFFVSSTLAPKFKAGGIDYVIDDPVGNVLVTVYLNSTYVVTDRTNSEGYVELYPLFMCAVREVYNVTAVVVDEGNLLYGKRYVQWVNFTKLTVHDSKTGGSDIFRLNCTVQGFVNGTSVHVATNNTIEAEAEACGKTLPNLNLTTVVARRFSVSTTGDRGNASVPVGVDYLRVVEQLDSQPLTSDQHLEVKLNYGDGSYRVPDSQDCVKIPMLSGGQSGSVAVVRRPFVGDVNHDGQVNTLDLILVAGLSGKKAGDPGWNPDADLNHDGTINVLDLIIVAGRLGSHEWVKCKIEFLKVGFENASATGNVGTVSKAWCPSETGTYLVQVKTAATLTAYVAAHCNVTDVYACLNRIRYYDVIKRPVSLSLDMPSDKVHSAKANAIKDTYACAHANYKGSNFGGEHYMLAGIRPEGGDQVDSEDIAYIGFSSWQAAVPQNAWIMSARLGFYCEYLDASQSPCSFRVHRVIGQWSEGSLTWNNQPTLEADTSFDFMASYWMAYRWFCLDVTDAVRRFHAVSAAEFGFAIGPASSREAWLVIDSRENASAYCPYLEILYVDHEPVSVLTACDGLQGGPLSPLQAQVYVNGSSVESLATNASGVALPSWRPPLNRVYNVTVASGSNATYAAGRIVLLCDFRFPTSIISACGNSTSSALGYTRYYSFNLTSPSADILSGRRVRMAVNGTVDDGGKFGPWRFNVTTDQYGGFRFGWAPQDNGTYTVRALFEGAVDYTPCETRVTVIVTVVPMAILFDVTPKELEPTDNVALNASVRYASNNSAVRNYAVKVQFYNVSSAGVNATLGNPVPTNANGVATLNSQYPDDDRAHAYIARIVPEYGLRLPQGVVSNPMQLTVCRTTRLLLNVSRDLSTMKHTVYGWLKWKNSGVSSKTIAIKLNETLYTTQTNQTGCFSLNLDLQPEDNKPTLYTITATFEDTNTTVMNATAWAYMIDGTRYAACTTVQYNGYKPSTNTTMLTVDPRATGMMTAKSPEQMQQEAESGNHLATEAKFSWWNPWFWLQSTVRDNQPTYGFSLVTCTSLFGGWLTDCLGLEMPLYKIFEGVTPQQVDILTSAAVSSVVTAAAVFVGGYLAAKATEWNIVAYAVANTVYFAAGVVALGIISTFVDAYVARAVLIATGWTLLSISTLGFTKTIPIYLSNIIGSDPVTASIKCIINTLLGVTITTAILKVLGISVGGFLFYFLTFILGIMALTLGYSRV